MIEDHSGTTFCSYTNDIYQELLDIIQIPFTDKQYEYLIIQLQNYCLVDAQLTEFKSKINTHRVAFTDDQWSQVSYLFSHNQLNDGQFSIFTDMLDTSRQKLVVVHASGGGGTGKKLLLAKN